MVSRVPPPHNHHTDDVCACACVCPGGAGNFIRPSWWWGQLHQAVNRPPLHTQYDDPTDHGACVCACVCRLGGGGGGDLINLWSLSGCVGV